MANRNERVELRGSRCAPLAEARDLGPADSGEQAEVTVFVRRRSRASTFPRLNAAGSGALRRRGHLSRADFAAAHGAAPEDLRKVRAFAARHRLRVVEERRGPRSVVLAGTLGDLGTAFDVRFRRYAHAAGQFRTHDGPVRIPAALAGIVTGVFGLDDRPQAHPHFRRLPPGGGRFAPSAAAQGYTPLQVAALYQFPDSADGTGTCIGILELGGGYRDADLRSYFQQLGVALPTVVAVSVDGAANAPAGDPNGADAEVVLDVEIAGAVAPGAKIAVYFAPNTDRGFLDALTTAVHDTANAPSVISISWGAAESTWTTQALDAFSSACQDAAAMGVTICAASGDNGSSDGVNDGQPHVDFPASSPYVLGCGGSTVQSTGTHITAEKVWNDLASGGGATGGGVSAHFALPTWQRTAGVPSDSDRKTGRGVPDVAGDAAPATGYRIFVDGESAVVGGTSAVAPLWAGLVARLNQLFPGHAAGFLNPLLYGKLPTDLLNDITQGNNGAYRAGPAWDACTGLGSPNGARLVAALQP